MRIDPTGLDDGDEKGDEEKKEEDPCDKIPIAPDDNVRYKDWKGEKIETSPAKWADNLEKKCKDCGCKVKTITIDVYDCLDMGKEKFSDVLNESSGILLQCCVKIVIGDFIDAKTAKAKGYCDKDKDYGGAPDHTKAGHSNVVLLPETEKITRSGYAKMPGKVTELRYPTKRDETGELDGTYKALAHELGHNANNAHVEDESNIMTKGNIAFGHPNKVTKGQCKNFREFAHD